jgi:hypothetical protein
MASRKPLVVVSGQVQQLQAGDTLDASVAGGDQINLTNDEATAVVIGSPVYADANDGFKKARANAGSTTTPVVGLVAKSPSIAAAASGPVTTDGLVTATTTEWDAVTGQTGGLTVGTTYYLDPATAGKMTITAPTTVGQYVMKLGKAISTTEFQVNIGDPILL